MKKKKKVKMPNKIGVVGRKPMLPEDRKARIEIWKKASDIEILGGIVEAKIIIHNLIDDQVNIKLLNKNL